ncbi:hypothetical protein [Parasphingopyxis lamellibrachiae]|nr:hypothetical protein [Parasphingopyxis lamellibrachiae]
MKRPLFVSSCLSAHRAAFPSGAGAMRLCAALLQQLFLNTGVQQYSPVVQRCHSMPPNMAMGIRLVFALGVAAMLAAPVSAPAQQRSEQDMVFENRQQGRVMPLRSIERRVVTQMRGYDYLGNPIYFESSNTYRMTFMRDGQVIRVEVDARSGRIRNRSDR